ncbi:hypothetical protein B566_EDAN008431 [Ephemera danica]|nr:hypothetical protein B566_EDAN008431 [Ephemera danica]
MQMNSENVEWTPSDGGLRAWLTVVGGFITTGISMGIVDVYSVIYVELLRILEEDNAINASYKASLVGSLATGIVFLLSVASAVLCDLIGIRLTVVLGTIIGSLGLLASSWLTRSVEALMFTYAVVFGTGTALVLTPSLAVLSFHFSRRLGLVNGIVCSGSALFGVALPPVVEALLPLIGLPGVFRVLSLLVLVLQLLGATTFQVPENVLKPKNENSFKFSSFLNKEIWKNSRYIIWCVAHLFIWFAFYVPYVHIVKYAEIRLLGYNSSQFYMYLALAAAASRIIAGVVADHPKLNSIIVQQVSVISMGILIMLMPMANTWGYLLAISIGLGLAEGGLVPLMGKIATELCGPQAVPQALGFLFALFFIPVTAGPALADEDTLRK